MRHLSAMMGSYPQTAPLKGHLVPSSLVALEFADISVAMKGFKAVVREEKYDVAELAIMTFLLAYDAGKPYLLLPFVMNGGFLHKSVLCRADSDLTPQGLAGASVALRSYSQTTPTWVRGILSDEYGVRTPDVKWLTQEGSHLAEYRDPEWATRLSGERGLEELLLSGEVDAIIAGSKSSQSSGMRTLIPHPAAAAADWFARTGVVPINQVVTVRREIAEADPELVREVFRMLIESRARAGEAPSDPDLQPVGFENLRHSLETAIRYAREQQLISKNYDVDELYGPVLPALA